MKHNKKEVILEFKLPEFSEKEVKVNISKNSVLVNAEKKSEKKVQRDDFFQQEKSYRSFSYSSTLPSIEPKKAKIEFRRGILKIKAPREK